VLIWKADERREQLVEELGQVRLGLTAAAGLVALAAVLLAMLPVLALVGSPNLDWLSPVLTSLAAVLTGTKLVAIGWGVLSRA